MALRRQLAQDACLKPVLDLIPAKAKDEQIYFYIWTQEESISNRVSVPAHFNLKCVKILKSWIVSDNALRLRPLAYKPTHFQDLFKFASNRNQIFTQEAIKKINDLLDISIPNILHSFLVKVKTYPIYQQYALAVVYFLHIERAYNKRMFLNFIYDGPTPPATNESIRARWTSWDNTAGQVMVSAQKEAQTIHGRTTSTQNKKSVVSRRPVASCEWSHGLSQKSSVGTFSIGNRNRSNYLKSSNK